MSGGYDVWLVDLDGTLVDVSPGYVHEVVDRVGSRLGVRFTPEEADQLWRGLRGDPELLLEQKGVEPTVFWTAYHEVEDPVERAEATFLYPDADIVPELPGPVGLVTHCQPYLTEPVLDALDIGDWFDVIVCCNDELGWKPDPGPVNHALASLGSRVEDAPGVLVGDTAADVGAAWNAGLDAVHVERYGAEDRGCCVRADRRLTELSALLDLRREDDGQGAAGSVRGAGD